MFVQWHAPFLEFWNFNTQNLSQIVRIPLFVIEKSTFVRCHVIHEIFSRQCSDTDCVDWLCNDIPSWMLYDDSHYRTMLVELSAPVLQNASVSCLSLVSHPELQRTKTSFIANILSFFVSERNFLVFMSDEDFWLWKKKKLLQMDCNRYHAFADYFTEIYGVKVSSALRELPYRLHTSVDFQLLEKISHEILWLSEGVDELVQRLEKCFNLDDLLGEIKKLPLHRRPVLFTRSRRKTANSLVDHIQRRVSYLSTLKFIDLLDVALSLYPHFHTTCVNDSDLIHCIIQSEYGSLILDGLTRSVMLIKKDKKGIKNETVAKLKKVKREEEKFEKIQKKMDLDLKEENDWPTSVSMHHILQCLFDYREGTIWKQSSVCAVCSQYSEKTHEYPLCDNFEIDYPVNLEILRLNDPFIENCISRNNPFEFSYDHVVLNNLILEKQGIDVISPSKISLSICNECYHSLKRNKMPRFALANKLYRGTLPEHFKDLTWVEEMACAIYRNTAHITRLYGSSDPAQPTVLHGNTCAHDMNVVSTASVLP